MGKESRGLFHGRRGKKQPGQRQEPQTEGQQEKGNRCRRAAGPAGSSDRFRGPVRGHVCVSVLGREQDIDRSAGEQQGDRSGDDEGLSLGGAKRRHAGAQERAEAPQKFCDASAFTLH